jgi:hypothetical protein
MSGKYCDRHEMHGEIYVEATNDVVVGNSRWKLCDECKQALHNWFANYPTVHDHVAEYAETNGEIIEENLALIHD